MTTAFKRMNRAIIWLMTISMALLFAVPAQAIEFFPTPGRYQWVAQSGTVSTDGTAHEVYVDAGDTVSMSLTIKNRTIDPRAQVWYGVPPGGNLLPEDAPYRGAHELRVGVKDDQILSWVDESSFLNNPDGDNNRFAVYDGADAYPGDNLTFTWDLKVKAGTPDGTYNLPTMVVREFDSRFRQVNAAGALLSSDDVFWRVIVGSGTTTPTTSGALNVNISSQTPAATTVAQGGNANFTRFTLSAASGTTVKISKLWVTRDGLSTDSEVENVKILDANMVQQGSTAGGFNSNHKAQIFFSPALEVTGTMDFYIRAGFHATSSSVTHTARLGIADNADIVSDATSTAGAPVWGNYMTVIDVTIGSLTLKEDGSITDTTPDVGDTNVVLNTFKLVNSSSTEDILVEQITVNKAGSADSSDTANIELWDVTNNVSRGEITSWGTNSKATFPVNITIAKGQTIRYRIQIDIVDGSSLTVNADLVDGSDVLVFAKGLTYGYYITPTCTAATDWTLDSGTGGTSNKGQGDKNQTINTGSLTISKSANTPPTGYIAVANDQELAVFDFEVRGEEMQISNTEIDIQLSDAGGSTTITFADLTGGSLVDANGDILAGPVDAIAVVSDDGAYDEGSFDFNDTYTLPVGINEVSILADLGTDFEASDTIAVTLAAAADITVKGIQTGNTVSATVTGAAGNTLTVKAGALVVETLGSPATSNIIVNSTDMVIGSFSFNAVASGEDVNVTQFIMTDTLDGTTGEIDDFVNYELWADLIPDDQTGGMSTRGDKYETQIDGPVNESGAAGESTDTVTFTLDVTLSIPKGETREVAIVADVASGATADGTHIIETASSAFASATGADTGTDIGETAGGLSTNATLTITAVGSMTSALAGSAPESAIVVADTSDNTLGAFTFTAVDEAFTIRKLTFDLTAGWDSVRYLTVTYPPVPGSGDSGTRTVGVSSAAISFDGLKMWVPKNDTATVTVTATTWGITSAPGSFRDTITLVLDTSAAGEFDAVGANSGTALTGSDVSDATANSMYLYKTKLTVASDNAGLDATIGPGEVLDLYRFKVTADSAGKAAVKKFTFSIFITDASTTTASSADLTNFTFSKNTGSGFVDITTSSQITNVTTSTPVTVEASNYVENNTSTTIQVTFDNSPVDGGEQIIDPGATVTYLLRAQAGTGFASDDAISVQLLGDTTLPTASATYLSDSDTGTGVEQVVTLQTSGGTQDNADVEFIWSDYSVLAHDSSFDDDGTTETSSADWTNGYLVNNFPLTSRGLTL